MTPGLTALKHLVVLMMENRSFDHMFGGLNGAGGIDGLTGNESNPDVNGRPVKVQPKAQYQGQLDPDPDHYFKAVHKQIFAGGTTPSGEVLGGARRDEPLPRRTPPSARNPIVRISRRLRFTPGTVITTTLGGGKLSQRWRVGGDGSPGLKPFYARWIEVGVGKEF